ncbi:hypothetical protein PHLGIDRAFT_265603 [Phlebiopsis gigantea 11061_1 CR5-6]|uniref:Uncharacterized protein n=1 Tax=Phlebiopsis gigantea (strain 11061_1 CR5-6) TaxID=745531 RepID=A0A0C3SE36_PHLG1|nr:hypothetical protein PHLGIDRAFT_265603 [Phlebiopsis gigantea 11061_1 CR5-6]
MFSETCKTGDTGKKCKERAICASFLQGRRSSRQSGSTLAVSAVFIVHMARTLLALGATILCL